MNLIEEIAEALHDGWWTAHIMNHWELGPRDYKKKNDNEKKMHPHLVPFAMCGLENNNFDKITAVLLLDILLRKLKKGNELDRNTVAEWAHIAWVRAAKLCGRREHPHIKDKWDDHEGVKKEEHLQQADAVLAIYDRYNEAIFSKIKIKW